MSLMVVDVALINVCYHRRVEEISVLKKSRLLKGHAPVLLRTALGQPRCHEEENVKF